jgi:UDP-glucose 4-epimerase
MLPTVLVWRKNEPLLIYGTGRQSQCFCYVKDVVEAAVSLMDCPQADGGVYNVGSTEEITIEALADRVIELAGSRSTKKFVSYRQAYGQAMDDMMRRVPCLERIRQATGWRPRTPLEAALKTVITDISKAL